VIEDLVELAPDVRVRVDHTEESDRGALAIVTTLGTREGGAFGIPRVAVEERDAQGRTCRIDMYDLDRLDAARSRFAELRPDPLRIPPNAASRAREPRLPVRGSQQDRAGERRRRDVDRERPVRATDIGRARADRDGRRSDRARVCAVDRRA
jgi:hypothetical protein